MLDVFKNAIKEKIRATLKFPSVAADKAKENAGKEIFSPNPKVWVFAADIRHIRVLASCLNAMACVKKTN